MDISSLGLGERPPLKNWEYANAAARTGATGFAADDIGKFARQTDTGAYWELTAVTPTWAELGGGAGIQALITVNAETLNTINVDVQIQDAGGNNLTGGYALWMWLSGSATEGTGVHSTVASGGIDADAGAIVVEAVSGLAWLAAFANGLFTLTISETGDPTWYLHVAMPDGSIVVSSAITFVI